MDTLYAARMHGFPNLTRTGIGAALLPGETPFSEENILSLLIVLGSSVSLVGLVFAFITYSLFSDLRNLSGTILMNMLAALFMTQLLYVIGVGGVPDADLCIALAFALQYIRLSVLCWMLCMTRHMYRQFQNNVNLRPTVDSTICRDFIKYSLFAWGLPGFMLGASVLVQYREKAGRLWDTKSLTNLNCWFLDNSAYIYGLLIPSSVLVLVTLSYLVRAAVVARYVASMQIDRRTRDKMRRKRTLQLFLFTKITLLLGIIIILGACAKLHKTTTTWIAFNVGQGLQGILVAMLVTCNCQVLKIYTRSIKSRGARLITAATTSGAGLGVVRGGNVELNHFTRSSISASPAGSSRMTVVAELDTLSATRMHGFLNISRAAGSSHVPAEEAMSEENILSLLIVLGSSVSLVGLVFAFITYSLFSDLRNLSGTTLMNLLASLFMSQLLYVIGVGGVPDSKLCVALAFSLQYIRLSVLCWMLCMTRHMYQQFRNNVNLRPVIETSICRDFVRYSIFSWGIPFILLGVSMIVHYHNKAGKLWETMSLMEHNCWFLDTSAYVYGLLIPATLLFITTITYLVRAGVVAKYIISMQVDKNMRHKMQRKRTMQIVLFSKLCLLLASVIILSAVAKLHKTTSTWIAFNAAQSLQGMLVAMVVTCNCHVLKIYSRSIKSRSTRLVTSAAVTNVGQGLVLGGGDDGMSKTTSLQMLTWDPIPEGV